VIIKDDDRPMDDKINGSKPGDFVN